MNIKKDKVLELSKKFDVDEFEIYNLLHKSIAKFYNATSAVIYKDSMCLGYLKEDFSIETRKVVASKKNVFSILKEFLQQLSNYSSNHNFYKFFKKERIYKAKALYMDDNNIFIEILNNDKNKLFKFFVPIEQLNYRAFKKIQNKEFFQDDNIFYIGIVKIIGKDNDEKVLCSMFNPQFLKNVFTITLGFLLRKYKKRYKLSRISIKVDFYSKRVTYFCSFDKRHRASYGFLGLLERVLENYIGKVKVVIKL